MDAHRPLPFVVQCWLSLGVFATMSNRVLRNELEVRGSRSVRGAGVQSAWKPKAIDSCARRHARALHSGAVVGLGEDLRRSDSEHCGRARADKAANAPLHSTGLEGSGARFLRKRESHSICWRNEWEQLWDC